MRLITLALLSSFAVLLSGLGSYSWGEFAEKYHISFSLAHNCYTEENDTNRSQLCLADSHKSGLNVVLVSNNVKCSAKTGKTFTQTASNSFKETRLKGTEKCLIVHPGSLDESTCVAVLGVDASSGSSYRAKDR